MKITLKVYDGSKLVGTQQFNRLIPALWAWHRAHQRHWAELIIRR